MESELTEFCEKEIKFDLMTEQNKKLKANISKVEKQLQQAKLKIWLINENMAKGNNRNKA